MDTDTVLGIARHIMTTAGGGLIAAGYVTSDQWTAIVGGLLALGVTGWSMYQKRGQKTAIAIAAGSAARAAAAPTASPVTIRTAAVAGAMASGATAATAQLAGDHAIAA